jgi:hypothetical protein
MAAIRSAGDRATKWIRWLARGIGSVAAAWWLFIGIMEVVWPHTPEASPEASLEGALLAGLMGVAILGTLVAWWREGIGGSILVAGGVALCIFAYVSAGHNKGFAVLVSGAPFLVAGALFLASWQRSRR